MTLLALPAFRDNYIWLLHDGIQALVVDPGDAQPVFDALRQWGLALRAILVTHHHPDHTGGVAALREATGATVWGPATEAIPEPFTRLREGDTVPFGPITFDVLDVPGHTAGHVAYYAASAPLAGIDGKDDAAADAPLLFCGDTLFSGGCGRLFEGTPAQMLASLDKLAALPGRTRVCCTHEYTLANLRFACAVEPANERLLHHQTLCTEQRAAGRPTLPSRIETERAINPFLRSRLPAVAEAVRAHTGKPLDDAAEVFGALREWKNHFQ